MRSESYAYLTQLLETLPVVSSHEHHFPDEFQSGLTLERLFENSYLFTMAGSTGQTSLPGSDYLHDTRNVPKIYDIPLDDPAGRADFLSHCRYNSYYVWLEKALQHIYSLDGPLTPENWDKLSSAIAARHARPAATQEILRAAGYRHAVLDPFWDYGSNIGHPELYSPTLRTDMFVTSFHPDATDHDGNSPFAIYPQAPTSSFADYLDFLEELFTGWHRNGGVALKSASAYERGLDYQDGDRQSASVVFYRHPEKVSPAERSAYEDYMFNWFCRLCLKFEVPFQVHTGLGKLAGSRAMAFEPTILRYPGLHFVLFHASYPWYDDIAGLLHNHSNLSADMVWAPLVSTSGAVQALHEYIEVAHSGDLIGWGGDAFTAEEAVGAVMAWRYVVARVLSEKVDDGYLSLSAAETLAEKLMVGNVAKRYELQAKL